MISWLDQILSIYEHWINALGFIITIFGLILTYWKVRSRIDEFKKKVKSLSIAAEIGGTKVLIDELRRLIIYQKSDVAFLKLCNLRERLTQLRDQATEKGDPMLKNFTENIALVKQWESHFSELASKKSTSYDYKQIEIFLADLKELVLKVETKHNLIYGEKK